MIKFYGVWLWEKRTALVVYQVVKRADDTWRMQTLLVSDKLDEVVPAGSVIVPVTWQGRMTTQLLKPPRPPSIELPRR